jgi:hypothetical protein
MPADAKPATIEGKGDRRPQERDASSSTSAALEMLLSSGGDERIWPDAETRRNRYGVSAAPARDEIWFSSSTASSTSRDGYRAAQSALEELSTGAASLPALFEDVRRRLSVFYGVNDCEVVLVPSGTEGELAALTVAHAIMPGPLTNIVVAPDETGSGVVLAAGGTNFQNSSSLGSEVKKGERLEGLEEADIEVRTVPVRFANGMPRRADAIDTDVRVAAEVALAAGRNVIVHVLDTSKTGLSGFSREAASALVRGSPGRILVVVDACQLRCSAERLRSDLRSGFVTLITGSKYAGGPPFCGAMFLPPQIVAEFRDKRVELAGLGGFSAECDWPEALRPAVDWSLSQAANLGLGLRWVATLDAIERYQAIDADLRADIVDRFNEEAMQRIESSARVKPLEDHDRYSRCSTIVPFVIVDEKGAPVGAEETVRIHRELRETPPAPAIHLGQAVVLGGQTVLRICCSMQHVIDIAMRYAERRNMRDAFAPLRHDLDAVFGKLEHLLAEGEPAYDRAN